VDSGIAIAGAGLLLSLGSLAVVAGALKNRVDNLEKRADEDRRNDEKRFKELYDSRNCHDRELAEVIASLKAVCDRLQRIEPILDKLAQGRDV